MTLSSRPVLTATRARSGRYGRHMLWVLLFGTLLAALGLFAAWTWKAPQLASANTDNGKPHNIAPVNAPDPDITVPQNGQPNGAPAR